MDEAWIFRIMGAVGIIATLVYMKWQFYIVNENIEKTDVLIKELMKYYQSARIETIVLKEKNRNGDGSASGA